MDDRDDDSAQTFLVRLWREPREAPHHPEWRGMIQHVTSGARRYFTRLEDVVDVIADHLGIRARHRRERPWWKTWRRRPR